MATYAYEEVKTQYVITKLGNGEKVIMCDFKQMRMTDCDTMTVGAIQSFFDSDRVKFFTEKVTTETAE